MTKSGVFQAHSVRLYDVHPKAIHSLSYDDKQKLLAVARSDGAIEIWNFNSTPHIERIIRERAESSVEGLAWCAGRLFSVGIHGFLVEYDLKSLSVKATHAATSGSAWCLAAHSEQKLIAVGTEDGYITLFDVLEESVCYNKVFDKQDGRIICLDWDASGEHLITGSVDAIRIWNVATGHAITRINPGRESSVKETIVWSVKLTADFTVISGDSRGKTCFWDGKFGSLITSVDSHQADVLTLCLSPDQSTLYAAGVDPVIALFSKVTLAGGRVQWVKSLQRIVHTHDVRALCLVDKKLISGGVDAYLNVTSYPPKMLFKYPPLPQGDIKLARKAGYLLFKHLNFLELWRLGSKAVGSKENIQENGGLPVKSEPIKLLKLCCKETQFIKAAAISSDGSIVAYSDETHIFVYSLAVGKNVSLRRMPALPQSMKAPLHLLLNEKKRLIVVSIDGSIQVVQLDEGGDHSIVHTFRTECQDAISLVDLSQNGQFLAVADHKSNVKVYDLEKLQLHATLPRYHIHPTALAIHPSEPRLTVVYADHKVVEYSLASKSYTAFSRGFTKSLPLQWSHRASVIRHIVFDERNPNAVIMSDDSVIVGINSERSVEHTDAKVARVSVEDKTFNPQMVNGGKANGEKQVTFTKKFKYVSFLGALSDTELVVVEVNPLMLSSKLPPILYKKRFGV